MSKCRNKRLSFCWWFCCYRSKSGRNIELQQSSNMLIQNSGLQKWLKCLSRKLILFNSVVKENFRTIHCSYVLITTCYFFWGKQCLHSAAPKHSTTTNINSQGKNDKNGWRRNKEMKEEKQMQYWCSLQITVLNTYCRTSKVLRWNARLESSYHIFSTWKKNNFKHP